MLAATAVALAFAAAFLGLMLRPDTPMPVTRVAVEFSEDQELVGLRQFDISQDGSRLLYRGPGARLVLVLNFFEELRRRTGGN